MVSLLSELHFWTTQEDVIIKHSDYGSYKYYTKKENDDSLTAQSKKTFCEQRGLIWTPLNKRPQKLRERLKELEDYLIHNRIVNVSWKDDILRLLLSTGLIVTISVNEKTGDISNISFDRQLSAKLQVNILCDGVIIGNQIICICNDGHVLGYGGHWKDGWVLEGGPRRRLNYYGEWLAVWGKASTEHPQPWSPLAKDHQRANLHLYWLGSRDPELLAYKKTDGEPLQVTVSKTNGRALIVVEQKVTQRGAVSVELSTLELSGSILKRTSVTSVPLQTQVSCTALSFTEDRLLICCIDGSLALLDRTRGSTRTVKAAFIPTFASWHQQGVVVAISNERGQLQYYDTGLNCLKTQFIGEDYIPSTVIDLSCYFSLQFSVASVSWGPKNMIISLEQGPLALITHVDQSLTFRSLLQRYLSINKVDKAIKLLLSWKFNEDSFWALQRLVAFLLRKSLTEETAQHLQHALGSFHNSPIPLSPQIKHRFGSQIISLTRRFFHQLVRTEMFETAFLLAVDIGHHDLFMDLYYIAVKIGETEMAAAARAQASALLSRCSSEASNCSRSSCSQCSDTVSSSSGENYASSAIENDSSTQGHSKIDYIRLPLNPDNCLATNFNQPDPTTYKPLLERENGVITTRNNEYHKPKAMYVKAPQVPSSFTKSSPTVPFTPPLPNISGSSLGIPYLNTQNSNPFLYNSNSMTKVFSSRSSIDLFSSSYDSNPVSLDRTFTTVPKVVPPPLPVMTNKNSQKYSISFNQNEERKKNQAKVKFSDTVTAFIVPEIKRAQRPAPPVPLHVTDPQKELADSLPLCHPNEDYLKDFSPVKKEDDNEESNNNPLPKIKVVHFGVV